MCMRLRHMELHGNAQSIPNPKYWGVVYASYNVGGVTTMDLLTSLNIIQTSYQQLKAIMHNE